MINAIYDVTCRPIITEVTRKVDLIRRSEPTLEGAGVKLSRAFNALDLPQMDPFLMLDHFQSSDPKDYEAGFPSHPHRGIETVTYMVHGSAEHSDHLGNKGRIGPGDVQWMTAGSGVIHGEMLHGDEDGVEGFQLWVNLPAASKMIPPQYRHVGRRTIPVLNAEGGVEIRIIAGSMREQQGPVQGLVTPIDLFDVKVPPGVLFETHIPQARTAFAYVFEGEGKFGRELESASAGDLIVYGEGFTITVIARNEGVRFLLASGPPLKEKMVWRGSVVMNTEDELEAAYREIKEGTFIK